MCQPYVHVCNCNINLSAVNMYKIMSNCQMFNEHLLVWLLIHVHTLVDCIHCSYGTDTNAHTNVHAHTTTHPCTCNTQTCMCMHIQLPHTHTCTHITMCTQDGGCPLHIASQEGHDRIVEMLLQAGATVDLQTKVEDFSYLFICHL